MGGANVATEKRADGLDELVVRQGSSFEIDAALGLIEGVVAVHKFAANPDVDTTPEFVDVVGGTYAGFLQAPAAVRVKAGGNAADTSDGAGARTIKVYGLDTNLNLAEEEITLAGASVSSPTTTQFWRIYRASVTGVGTYNAANTGAITVETTGGVVMATIGAGVGSTEMAVFTVPVGYKLLVTGMFLVVESTNSATIRMWKHENMDDVVAPMTSKKLVSQWRDISGAFSPSIGVPWVFPEKTDVWFEAQKVSGPGTSEVVIEGGFYLIPQT